MKAQHFLTENKPADFDNNDYISMLQDAAAAVTDSVLGDEELETYLFSDGSYIVRLADEYNAFESIDDGSIEWDDDLAGYYVINKKALLNDIDGCVFEDSYGDGVALYNNTSCSTYRALAEAAGLDYQEYANYL